jgi:hypothetical protein
MPIHQKGGRDQNAITKRVNAVTEKHHPAP